MLPDFYGKEILEETKNNIEYILDNLAKALFDAGKIKSEYSDHDWKSRLIKMKADYPEAPLVFIKKGILPQALQKMYSDDRILDIAEQLGVGPEVALNPAWNLRAKMQTYEETVVPWHQDNSYWEPRIWDEKVFTVWVALVDAYKENGCM